MSEVVGSLNQDCLNGHAKVTLEITKPNGEVVNLVFHKISLEDSSISYSTEAWQVSSTYPLDSEYYSEQHIKLDLSGRLLPVGNHGVTHTFSITQKDA